MKWRNLSARFSKKLLLVSLLASIHILIIKNGLDSQNLQDLGLAVTLKQRKYLVHQQQWYQQQEHQDQQQQEVSQNLIQEQQQRYKHQEVSQQEHRQHQQEHRQHQQEVQVHQKEHLLQFEHPGEISIQNFSNFDDLRGNQSDVLIRGDVLRRHCEASNSADEKYVDDVTLISDKTRRIGYCHVPKVASSSW